ncbi:MAG: T9SS type A sorting domain-containing protein, partial [candidate division KSB1 bacterium]|nr:T9SS type A sorting domain-containing protein [candidate division KSB1 bacterium]
IENERAGYGSLAADPNNIAIPASHHTLTNEEACNVWYDFIAGFGFFTPSNVWSTRAHGSFYLEPFWPDVAVGVDDIWHVTATNNNQDDFVELVNDVNDNIIYWRSTDRGMSWSDWKAMFPDTVTYPLTSGASGPSEAGSHQVETSDTDNGRVGVLVANPGHDFYLFESFDDGVTWNDAYQVIGNTFFTDEDSLSAPFLWDVVIIDSSEFGGDIDTILYPFYHDSETGEPETWGPRPHGPADLLYVNGEPHVVWNQTLWTSDNSYYPNGYSYTWTNPAYKFLDGSTRRRDANFSIKHWSPSTGVSTIWFQDETSSVWPGTFQQYVTMPQIGVDESGSLYCLFTKYSDTDTLLASDGISQADTDFGPLSFGRIWGAKSDDGGATWYDAVQMIPEEDCIHQNLRYIAVANQNGNDAIQILYQNTPDVPGVPIGEGSDHSTWANANMMHWAIPTSAFPMTMEVEKGPELLLETSSTMGGLHFGDIGNAGEAMLSFKVHNIGDEDLVVDEIFTTDKSFNATPTSFTVAPGGMQEVQVTFKPRTDQMYDEILALPNNDPTEGNAGIPLEGMGLPTSVAETPNAQPATYALAQNYPNPFNPVTHISFSLKQAGQVKLAVYNALGEEVDVLVNENMRGGSHTFTWKPSNVSSGVYFYRITAGEFSSMKKMILMK